MRRSRAIALAALSALVASSGAGVQNYPVKPIRFIVPLSPGGGTDMLARAISQRLNEAWGQPVVVDHRPGGTGAVGSVVVAQAAPNGYTLLMVTSSTHAIAPNLHRKPPYNRVKDFAPVALTVSAAQIVVAHPSVPAASIKELVDLAKAKPGALNYASPGTGTIGHMTGELFKMVTGTKSDVTDATTWRSACVVHGKQCSRQRLARSLSRVKLSLSNIRRNRYV